MVYFNFVFHYWKCGFNSSYCTCTHINRFDSTAYWSCLHCSRNNINHIMFPMLQSYNRILFWQKNYRCFICNCITYFLLFITRFVRLVAIYSDYRWLLCFIRLHWMWGVRNNEHIDCTSFINNSGNNHLNKLTAKE